jgi:hypothetical protein
MAGRCVVVGHELGRSWRARRRAAGEGNRAGVGRGRRVGSRRWSGGGGRAAARSKALHRWQEETEQSSTCPRKKKRGEGSGGLFGNFKNSRDFSVK